MTGELNRRDVLSGVAVAVVGQACGGTSPGGMSPEASDAGALPDDAGAEGGDAGCGSCSSSAKTLSVDVAAHPSLAAEGGSLFLTDPRYSDPHCGNSNIVIIRTGGKFAAFSSSCTHACCTVAFTGSQFRCPCHGSEFDTGGNVVRGPAREALASVPLCSDGCGHLTLTLG